MPSTKYKIAEQVKYMLEAGADKQAAKFKMDDITELIGQVINKLLRTTHFAVTMQQDGQQNRIPDGMMLATYENIAVASYHGRSRAILPAVPIQLPDDVGLFQVSPQGDWSCEYIPVPPGQWWMIQKEGLISDILGQIGRERFGLDVVFTKDLTALASPVNSVMVRMAIVDISKLSDYDLLPIPADMEADVVTGVYNILANPEQKPKPNIVDTTSQPNV